MHSPEYRAQPNPEPVPPESAEELEAAPPTPRNSDTPAEGSELRITLAELSAEEATRNKQAWDDFYRKNPHMRGGTAENKANEAEGIKMENLPVPPDTRGPVQKLVDAFRRWRFESRINRIHSSNRKEMMADLEETYRRAPHLRPDSPENRARRGESDTEDAP